MSMIRTLGLEKAGHTFIIRYQVGMEDEAVEELMRMADDRTTGFSWMDAATLSFQITQFAADHFLGEIQADELTAD